MQTTTAPEAPPSAANVQAADGRAANDPRSRKAAASTDTRPPPVTVKVDVEASAEAAPASEPASPPKTDVPTTAPQRASNDPRVQRREKAALAEEEGG